MLSIPSVRCATDAACASSSVLASSIHHCKKSSRVLFSGFSRLLSTSEQSIFWMRWNCCWAACIEGIQRPRYGVITCPRLREVEMVSNMLRLYEAELFRKSWSRQIGSLTKSLAAARVDNRRTISYGFTGIQPEPTFRSTSLSAVSNESLLQK